MIQYSIVVTPLCVVFCGMREHSCCMPMNGTNMDVRDRSIFIGGLGPVQKVIGHILFLAKIIIELELFSTSAMIG